MVSNLNTGHTMTINSLDQKQAESIIGAVKSLHRSMNVDGTIEEVQYSASNTNSKKTITHVALKKDISLKSNIILVNHSNKPSPASAGFNPIVDDTELKTKNVKAQHHHIPDLETKQQQSGFAGN